MQTSEWRVAWEDSDLEPWCRRVLCGLSCSMGGDGGQKTECRPGYATIGKRAGYKETRVRQVVKELDTLGWINVRPRHGKPNRYYATVPKAYESVVEDASELKVKSKTVAPKTEPCRVCGEPSVQGSDLCLDHFRSTYGEEPTSTV